MINLDAFFSVCAGMIQYFYGSHLAELDYCLFYLNRDRLEDSRTVQEYLWQIQCQPA